MRVVAEHDALRAAGGAPGVEQCGELGRVALDQVGLVAVLEVGEGQQRQAGRVVGQVADDDRAPASCGHLALPTPPSAGTRAW